MRLVYTVVILTTVFSLGFAAHGNAQLVSINRTEATLATIIKDLRAQTGYSIILNKQVAAHQLLSIHKDNTSLSEVLDELGAKAGFRYSLKEEEKLVTIEGAVVARPDRGAGAAEASLLILAIPEVKGRIVDSVSNPLVGASVRAMNAQGQRTTLQTQTDHDGWFVLRNVPDDAQLEITYVGHVVRRIAARADVGIIVLTAVSNELEEVEVGYSTGYQRIPKERATGSFVLIDSAMINRTVATNILDRINGITNGLLVNAGRTSSIQPSFTIRGVSTINSNNEPLIIVDNFPYSGGINNINPNDVENITVLKDAAAASIWGARAGNGVVVITTKRGKNNEQMKISATSNVTVSEKPNSNFPLRLSSADYIEVEEFLFRNGYYDFELTSILQPAISPVVELLNQRRLGLISAQDSATQIARLATIDSRDQIDQYLIRHSVNQQHALSISGGTNQNSYFLSLGFDKNETFNKGDGNDRITLNGNNTFTSKDRKLEVNTNFILTQSQQRNNGITNIGNSYPYTEFVSGDGTRLNVVKDFRQSYKDTIGQGKLLNWNYNPLDELELNDNAWDLFEIRSNNSIRYRLAKGLDIKINYQYTRGLRENASNYDARSYYVRDLVNKFSVIDYNTGQVTYNLPVGGILDKQYDKYRAHNLRTGLSYTRRLTENHEVSFMGGAELFDNEQIVANYRTYGVNERGVGNARVNYTTFFPTLPQGSGQIPQAGNNTNYKLIDRYLSYFANASYTLYDKYTLSGSVRKDESNIFGVETNQKGVPLWSAGASYDLTKDNLLDAVWINYLRVRATVGYNGNVNKNLSAQTSARIASGANNYNAPWAVVLNPPNPLLRWERVRNVNVGVDYSLFSDWLYGSLEFFQKYSTDLIGDAAVAPQVGFTQLTLNSADMKGSGVDLNANLNLKTEKIQSITGLNFSYVANKVTNYKIKRSTIEAYMGTSTINPLEGYPVFSVFSYRWGGLDSIGDPLVVMNGEKSKNYSGLSSSSDFDNLLYNGSAIPRYHGNLMQTFRYQNLELSVNLTYKFDYYFRRPSVSYNAILGSGHPDYAKRWQAPGDELNTNVPAFTRYLDFFNSARDRFYGNSEILVERGDHIRLQNIQFQYNINLNGAGVAKSIHCALYAVCNNLWILWRENDSNIDPDFIHTPIQPKSLSLGIKLTY